MKEFEVSWYEGGSLKVLGPYTFSQAIKWAQKIYHNPEVKGIHIQEVAKP